MSKFVEENYTGPKYGDTDQSGDYDLGGPPDNRTPEQPQTTPLMDQPDYYGRAKNVGPGNYNIESFRAPNREVGQNELAGNRLDMMLDESRTGIDKKTALKMFWNAGHKSELDMKTAANMLSKLKQPTKNYYYASDVEGAVKSMKGAK